MKKHIFTIAIIAASVSFASAQTDITSQREAKVAKVDASAARPVAAAADLNYPNASSWIYNDSRTPRFPLSKNEQENHDNYAKAKAVWIENNPEEYKKMNQHLTPTATQEKERQKK
jgi:hypothetical protein